MSLDSIFLRKQKQPEEDLYKIPLSHLPIYLRLCLYILSPLLLGWINDLYVNLKLTPTLVPKSHLPLPTQEHCSTIVPSPEVYHQFFPLWWIISMAYKHAEILFNLNENFLLFPHFSQLLLHFSTAAYSKSLEKVVSSHWLQFIPYCSFLNRLKWLLFIFEPGTCIHFCILNHNDSSL